MDNMKDMDLKIKLSSFNIQLEPIDINPDDLKMDINITPIDVKLKKFPEVKILEILQSGSGDCR